MYESDEVESLRLQLEALETSLAGTSAMAQGFEGELRRVQGSLGQTSQGLQGLERGLSRGLRRAFDAVLLDGVNLSEAMRGLALSISQTVYAAAMKPVTDHFGGLLAQGINSLMPFEKGAAFVQGRVTPFARGGVVTGPTRFPMRGGLGLMGEAGPEAILPLRRGRDGKLGVASDGRRSGPMVVMHVTTPDVQGFQRSQSQISARMGRLLSRASRIR